MNAEQLKQEIKDLFARYGARGDVSHECVEIIDTALDELIAEALRGVRSSDKVGTGWAIRLADGRWRTLDSIGMPDITADPDEALVFRLRKHADIFAADDPEDVRIVPAEYGFA